MFATRSQPVASRTRSLLTPLALVAATLAPVALAGCGSPQPVLLRLMEARRLAAELQSDFTRANEASERAVLADTDDVSASAARDAAALTASAATRLGELESVVKGLGYSTELERIAAFKGRFDEFQTLDREILALAVENTNLKAQRLSFGAARELGEQIASELEPLRASSGDAARDAEALRANVFELLFLEARHNAEAEDAEMTHLETRAAALLADSRARLARLSGKGDAAQLRATTTLWERFVATHDEVIVLSRRNTNVRSLALTLGRKRVVVAACEAELAALRQALAGHGTEATR